MQRKGFTLIEIVLYIGLIMILLPSIILMLLEVQKSQAHSYTKMLIEQTSAIILSEIQNEMTSAYSIDITNSTLDSDESAVQYRKNQGGPMFDMSYDTDTVDIGSVLHNIGRIKYYDGSEHWITPEQIAVTKFRIEPVRNSLNELTALNFELELSPFSTSAEIDKANVLYTHTTISLFPTVTEE